LNSYPNLSYPVSLALVKIFAIAGNIKIIKGSENTPYETLAKYKIGVAY